MPYMKVSVGLGRETRMHTAVINVGFIVLVYYVLNEVYRLNRCVTVFLSFFTIFKGFVHGIVFRHYSHFLPVRLFCFIYFIPRISLVGPF